jgi:hypothetical protein
VNALREGFVKLSKDKDSETFVESCDKAFGLQSPPTADYKYYGTKWFDFAIELVSDCWDESVEGFEDTPITYCSIVISGDSAWSPPEKLTQELCKAYRVRARHEYEESGNDFAGITTFDEEGDCDQETYTYWEFKYKYDQDWWWDEMTYQIQEGYRYESYNEFAEEHKYADIDDLNEAWNRANKNEDQ